MKLTVILPTYNGALFIHRAMQSVLKQSFRDFELIVLDDGSTDDTAGIVNEISKNDERVRYLRNEKNLGIQKSLNRGIHEARGIYIARIDDDDTWIDEDKLDAQIGFLEANTDYVLIGTGVVMKNEDGEELFRFFNPLEDFAIREKMLFQNCFSHSSVVFRKDAALRVGGYKEDASVRHVEDYDLWLKMGMLGKLKNLPRYSIDFLMRGGSLSSRNKIDQLKKDIMLTRQFKDAYPHYHRALARGYLRYIGYSIFESFPTSFKKRVWESYKKQAF